MKKIINKQKYIVFGTIFIYVFLFTYLAFATHDGLKSQMNDLGNAVQPIYNTTKGHFMMASNCTLCENPVINRLGTHANFIFLFFVPIYYIFANPKVLLFIQTLIIGLGALPLYWFGKDLFSYEYSSRHSGDPSADGDSRIPACRQARSPRPSRQGRFWTSQNDLKCEKKSLLPLLGPFAYLINPMVHDVSLYDFHALAIAMPFILFAFYFMYTKKYFWFYIFAILLALTKEDMPLIVMMLGLYMVFVQKEWRKGLIVSLASLVYFFLTVEVFMPFFANGEKSVLVAQRYAHLGGSVAKIIPNLILRPDLLISNLFSIHKLAYLLFLLIPTLFLPILSLEILLLSLPTVFVNLLSLSSMMHYPFQYYHMAPILSFVFLAYVK